MFKLSVGPLGTEPLEGRCSSQDRVNLPQTFEGPHACLYLDVRVQIYAVEAIPYV